MSMMDCDNHGASKNTWYFNKKSALYSHVVIACLQMASPFIHSVTVLVSCLCSLLQRDCWHSLTQLHSGEFGCVSCPWFVWQKTSATSHQTITLIMWLITWLVTWLIMWLITSLVMWHITWLSTWLIYKSAPGTHQLCATASSTCFIIVRMA